MANFCLENIIFFKLPEKIECFWKFAWKIDFFVKFPEKIDFYWKFVCKNRIFFNLNPRPPDFNPD